MARTPMKDMSVYYEDLEGTSIRDRYVLKKFMKAGGSSGVYLSYDSVMSRQVAVKLLPPSDKVMGTRFEREARGLSVLSHPNTVSVYDFGRTPEGYYYMVLEYLEGGTLKETMTAERWVPPRRAFHIFSQICRSLRDAHQKGIVHRDIKPSNIFLIDCDGDKEFVKVLDFGVAKMLGDKKEDQRADITQIGRIIGTPRYMPPEQITSQDVDARADVYTVGVVLYEMLCGSVPFLDTSLGGLLMLHLKEPPPSFESHRSPYLSDTPPGVEAAVRKALEKQPLDRFDTIEEFRESVEEAMDSGIVEASPVFGVRSPGYIPPPLPGEEGALPIGMLPGDMLVDAVELDEELEPILLEPLKDEEAFVESEPMPRVSPPSPERAFPKQAIGIGVGVFVLLLGMYALLRGEEEGNDVAPPVEVSPAPSLVEDAQEAPPTPTPAAVILPTVPEPVAEDTDTVQDANESEVPVEMEIEEPKNTKAPVAPGVRVPAGNVPAQVAEPETPKELKDTQVEEKKSIPVVAPEPPSSPVSGKSSVETDEEDGGLGNWLEKKGEAKDGSKKESVARKRRKMKEKEAKASSLKSGKLAPKEKPKKKVKKKAKKSPAKEKAQTKPAVPPTPPKPKGQPEVELLD